MDVGARVERGDETGILRQVSDAPQLDLVVIGDEHLESLRGHERLAELPALVAAHRDVVEVRLVRREPPGARDGLVERRVDAPVGRDLVQQALAIRGTKLLDLAVREQQLDDRMLIAKALERRCVGRVTGLRLLLRREPELVEQHLTQLVRRVHVELDAGLGLDRLIESMALAHQPVVERSQLDDVDPDADSLHSRQHTDERVLDRVVERAHALVLERLLERGSEPRRRNCVERGRRAVVDSDAVEIELELVRLVGAELEPRVPSEQVADRVARLSRVEEVRGDARVELEVQSMSRPIS